MNCGEVFDSDDVCVNPESYRNGKEKVDNTYECKKETFQMNGHVESTGHHSEH